jgi:Tol biopolymer transport system component
VPDDANSWPGVFRRDLLTGTTQRVSVAWDGSAANNRTFGASISGDGRHIAFASAATNLVPDDANRYSDVFIRNLG